MRQTLTELFGTNEPLLGQFVSFWRRLLVGDLGPSLIAFPTPAMKLVMLALPWTLGLLSVTIVISWFVGNILGGLAGYYQNSRFLKAFGVVAMGIQPIPYYIVAFLMVIVFGFVWPILPIMGGFAMNVPAGLHAAVHRIGPDSRDPSRDLAGPGRTRHLVPGHAGACLECRHRGLRRPMPSSPG